MKLTSRDQPGVIRVKAGKLGMDGVVMPDSHGLERS